MKYDILRYHISDSDTIVYLDANDQLLYLEGVNTIGVGAPDPKTHQQRLFDLFLCITSDWDPYLVYEPWDGHPWGYRWKASQLLSRNVKAGENVKDELEELTGPHPGIAIEFATSGPQEDWVMPVRRPIDLFIPLDWDRRK